MVTNLPGQAYNVLTSDILIADIIAPIEYENGPKHTQRVTNEKLQALVTKYDIKPGEKRAINKEQFEEFSAAVRGTPIKIMPGGSSANVMTTMSKLLGNVKSKFIGAVGEGVYSHMIRDGLTEAKVDIIPEKPVGAESAVSFVVLFPSGQRAIMTYPGNAKSILKPDLITEDMVKNSDAVLVQGSLWQKLDWQFADRLLEQRWKHGKELWLAMPTHAQFGKDKAEHFQWLIPSANVVLSNDEELARVLKCTPDQAAEKLQLEFQKQELENKKTAGKWHGSTRQVGFITRGPNLPVAIVTADGVDTSVSPLPDPPGGIVNTLGAGDTSFAGFLAGYMAGLPNKASAQIAMELAAAKLQVNGPRLENPREALKEANPDLADMLPDGTKPWATLARRDFKKSILVPEPKNPVQGNYLG